MKQLGLPLAGDFCTVAWAAEHIGVSKRTVQRLMADGGLSTGRPLVGPGESDRRYALLFAEEVRAYALARHTVRGVRG